MLNRYLTRRPGRPAHFFAAAGCVVLFASYVFAQDRSDPIGVKEIFAYVIGGAGALSVAGSYMWALWNRKSYDKLNEAIDERDSLLEAKKERIEQLATDRQILITSHTEEIKKLELKVEALSNQVEALTISNLAVVGQNLQCKAILKQLRLSGVWEGNENDIFRQSGGSGS